MQKSNFLHNLRTVNSTTSTTATPTTSSTPTTSETTNTSDQDIDNSVWGLFVDRAKSIVTHSTNTSTSIIDLRRYEEDLFIDRDKNPLDYWQSHEVIYPRLNVFAKQHLGTFASSVPSDRIFSKAGLLISER